MTELRLIDTRHRIAAQESTCHRCGESIEPGEPFVTAASGRNYCRVCNAKRGDARAALGVLLIVATLVVLTITTI